MSKSDAIQWRYREILVDPCVVGNFSLEDRLHYACYRQSDELLDLIQELTDKVNEIVDNKITPRQKQVMHKVYREGLTQTEVANELGLCQPTIHKLIFGNISYEHNKKRYGGAVKKVRKICMNDALIQQILTKIELLKLEIRE